MRVIANQKDFVIDVLGASTTKREAKSFLNQFQSESRTRGFVQGQGQLPIIPQVNNAVNLGSLFGPLTIEPSGSTSGGESITTRQHIAIVMIRAPDVISDEVLHGVTRTLSQLSQLGMHCVVIPDMRDYTSVSERRFSHEIPLDGQKEDTRKRMIRQADRIVDALETHLNQRSHRLDYLFKVDQHTLDLKHLHRGRITPNVENMHLLEQCIYANAIPVVVPVVRTKNSVVLPIHTKQAAIALSRHLAGTADFTPDHRSLSEKVSQSGSGSTNYKVDRIIVLDSVGGIPAGPAFQHAHVFINLEQEYSSIKQELDDICNADLRGLKKDLYPAQIAAGEHLKNLSFVRRALKFLPPTASALITSPEAVARYEHSSNQPHALDVSTRPQKNILIHNILTDKPIRSSSLPQSRILDVLVRNPVGADKLSATFLKHGMPLTIVPDPKTNPWRPSEDLQVLSLRDPRLDIGRLVHLIEDSFGRPLDQKAYFERIAPSLAGIIVAGAYEGGAILTWERPTSAPLGDTSRLVPYLDKFAVLKRSQGAGGVADIVFSAMVRDCFPQGVCWRSRSNNPVNKWYFERARGTYTLSPEGGEETSAQNWTMFWTTEDIQGQRFHDYEEVCRSIQSSWADGKPRLD